MFVFAIRRRTKRVSIDLKVKVCVIFESILVDMVDLLTPNLAHNSYMFADLRYVSGYI